MKSGFAFCIISVALFMVSCNQNNDKRKSFNDVVEYNDFIVDHIEKVNAVYTQALDTSLSIEEALKACDELTQLCEKSTLELKNIQPFDRDSSLTMQTLQYFQYMKVNGNNKIKHFLTLEDQYLKSEFTDEEALISEIEAAIGEINLEQEIESEKVNVVQKKFATKHDMLILN